MLSRFSRKKNAAAGGVGAGAAAGAQEDNPDAIPILQLGDEVPDFVADSQVGSICLHDLIDGGWAALIFFTKDFDPVHTTELGALSKLKEEFDSRQVKIVAVSPDTKLNHQKWILDVQELQDCRVSFPIVADDRAEVCKKYGLLRLKDYGRVLRGNARLELPSASLFIVDIDKRIRMIMHYSPSVGRNFYEMIRAIDALQLAFFHQVGTPCNWMQTEDVFIKTEIPSDAAQSMFPKGFMEIRPWFRLTPQPDTET